MDVISSSILGTQEFVDSIKEKYLSGIKEDNDLPSLKLLRKSISIEAISEEVDKMMGDDTTHGRKIKIYLCRKYTGERLDDIGEKFGIGGSGVCKIWRQVSDKIGVDIMLRKSIKELETRLELKI